MRAHGLSASRFADLGPRLVSAAVLAPLAFLLIWLGGPWAAGLVAALAAAMAWEVRSVVAAGGGHPGAGGWIAAASGAGAVIAGHLAGPAGALALLAGAGALAVIDLPARRAAFLWSAGGLCLVGVAAMALQGLRATEPYGLLSTIWVVVVVVASDTGGYFAGRIIGGAKLWPAVSPKKTWAGLAGGVGLAFFAGGLFSWATTGTYFHEVCTVSALAALLAQAGDLAESSFKRRFAVKDSGRLIPGHGGALDRFDGLMAATLVGAAVTFWRGQAVFIW